VVEALSPIAAPPVLIYARSAYYPRQAEAAKLEGRAVVECLVRSDHRVTACAVLAEAPESQGFGAAALRRVGKLTVRPTRDTGPTAGRKVRFPVYWKPVDSRSDALTLRPDGDLPERKVRRGPLM
jgi:TonB family protein